MNCPGCGIPAPSGASFCSNCGQVLQTHGDERRIVTVLFADLVGFTRWSENMDPESVKSVIDSAFERLVDDVVAFGGKVDKIVGDGILALFGAPVAHEDDAERAVRAGLRMQQTLAKYSEESGIAIEMRIGINTGEVLVGALRAGGDYTAMGDVVNTASRLQTMAQPGEVLVGAATQQGSRQGIAYHERGSMVIRGRADPMLVFSADAIVRQPGHRNRSKAPLVGRSDEVALLNRLIQISVRQRRGQVVMILGEAGVGKTRLADEVPRLVANYDASAVELRGRCLPYGEANPWWPIAEILRSAVGMRLETPPKEAKALAERLMSLLIEDHAERPQMVDAVMHMLGYDSPLRSLDPHSVKTLASRTLTRLAELTAQRSPVILRVSDLQWADESVLEIINSATPALTKYPIILILTAREELFHRWAPTPGRYNMSVLNLEVLDRESLGELLDSLVEDPLEHDLREELLDRSGGNPLYLEELAVAAADREASAVRRDGGAQPELPTTLQGLVSARLDGLTPQELATVEDAAVWGARGPLMALSEIARAVHDVSNIDDVIESLVDKEILVVDEELWWFRSHLFSEVAYSRITKLERLQRHAGIARYLEEIAEVFDVDDGLVDTVARHYFEAAQLSRELSAGSSGERSANLVPKALEWLEEAARRSETSAFWGLSARLNRRGLLLLDGDEDKESRLRLQLSVANALCEQWSFDEALVESNVALDLAQALGDQEGIARATMLRGHVIARKGNLDEAALLLDDAIARFDKLGDLRGRAEALRVKGMSAIFSADGEAAVEPIQQSLDAFVEIGDRKGEAWALQNLAWITFMSGDVSAAEYRLNRSAEVFMEQGDANGIAWTRGLLAFIRFQQGKLGESRSIASEILADAEERRDRWAQAMMHIALAFLDLWDGHTADSIKHAKTASSVAKGLGDPIAIRLSRTCLARALAISGLIGPGIEEAQSLIADVAGTGDIFGVEELNLAMIQLHCGNEVPIHELEQSILDGSGQRPNFNSDGISAVILATAQAGDVERAIELIDEGDPLQEGRSLLDAIAALVCGAGGEYERADEFAERVTSKDEVSYLDKALALLALTFRSPGDSAAILNEVDAVLARTEDKLTPAVVATFRNALADFSGDKGLASDNEDSLWASLGVEPRGWRKLLKVALKQV